jgi:hypothetical protein
MFRSILRPSPLGLFLGVLVIAFWALLWLAFFAQILDTPQKSARQAGPVPELARVEIRAAARAT